MAIEDLSSQEGKDLAANLYIAGGFLSAAGSLHSGLAQASALNTSADIQDANSATILESAVINERIMRRQFTRLRGEVEANVGASGVQFEGSILDAMLDGAVELERDAMNLKRKAQIEAANARARARAAKKAAKGAKIGAVISVGAAVVTGGTSLALLGAANVSK